jgi:hypothetical protein
MSGINNEEVYTMKSIKKVIAVICIVLFLTTPLAALSDEQQQGSTGVEQSGKASDTQQGVTPEPQVTPQAPEPAPEQPDTQMPPQAPEPATEQPATSSEK